MKPSNVMIARDGRVKVIDFGIAQLLRPGHRGTMIGTPGYAPPEQYQGITNAQSDEYALAATLHHLLTGRDPREHAPFSFPPAHTLNKDVSKATSRALQKALQMEMEDRFPTVQAFRQALPIAEVVQPPTPAFEEAPPRRRGSPVPASTVRQSTRPATTPARPQRQPFRQRVRRALLATIIGAGLLATAPEWAPAIGTAIANVIESVTDSSGEERNATPLETAQQPSAPPAQSGAAVASIPPASSAAPPSSVAEVSAPPTQAVPSSTPAPVIVPASAVPSSSIAPSPSVEPSASVAASPSAPESILFRATIEVDVAEDSPSEEIAREFERVLLEKARETYPNAALVEEQELKTYSATEDTEDDIVFLPAEPGRWKLQANVGALIIPSP
jgi:serine/threonine protein kinase